MVWPILMRKLLHFLINTQKIACLFRFKYGVRDKNNAPPLMKFNPSGFCFYSNLKSTATKRAKKGTKKCSKNKNDYNLERVIILNIE